MEVLDDLDRRILDILTEDGRVGFGELAERAHTSRASAYRRVERMEKAGVITGYTITVNPRAVGKTLTAVVFVNADQGEWRKARDAIRRVTGVEWVGMTAGSFDFILLVRVKDSDALRDTVLVELQALPAVTSTETIFVLNEEGRL